MTRLVTKTLSGVLWDSGVGGQGLMMLLCLAMTTRQNSAAPLINEPGTDNTSLAYPNVFDKDQVRLATIVRLAFKNMSIANDTDFWAGIEKMQYEKGNIGMNDSNPEQRRFFSNSDDWEKTASKDMEKHWKPTNEYSFAVKHPDWKLTKKLQGIYHECLEANNACSAEATACRDHKGCDEAYDALKKASFGTRGLIAMYRYLIHDWYCILPGDRCKILAATLQKGDSCSEKDTDCWKKHGISCFDHVLTSSADARDKCWKSKTDECIGKYDEDCRNRRWDCMNGLRIMTDNWHFCRDLGSDPCNDNNDISSGCSSFMELLETVGLVGKTDEVMVPVILESIVENTDPSTDLIDGTCFIKLFYSGICSQTEQYEFTPPPPPPTQPPPPTTTVPPPTTTPPPPACNWVAAEANDEELEHRQQHVKINGRMLRTFDLNGNIILHAAYSSGASFSMMFNVPEPTLNLELCQDAGSECGFYPGTNPKKIFSIQFKNLTSEPSCDIPKFDSLDLGKKGVCRKATWKLTGVHDAQQFVKVDFGGKDKEDYENCNMTLKIESNGIEKCEMLWFTWFSEINTSDGPVQMAAELKTGTMTTEQYQNSQTASSSKSEMDEKGNQRTNRFKEGGKTTETDYDKNTFDTSVEAQAKAGVGVETNMDVGPIANASASANADVTATYKAGYGKQWGSESQKSVTYDKEDNNVASSRNVYTKGSGHSSSTGYSLTISKYEEKTFHYSTIVGPGERCTFQQLAISCRYAYENTPYYRAFSGDDWDPEKALNIIKKTNSTEAPEDANTKETNTVPTWFLALAVLVQFGFTCFVS